MPLKLRLQEYVRACFSGIWIESHEHEDALLEIAELCREEEWHLLNWDIDAGLQTTSESGAEAGNDPLAAIRAAAQTGDNTTLLVLRNFHRFMQSPEVIQALANQVALGKQQRTFFVVLSPVVQIPIELEKLFVVIEHQLPSRSQLDEIARAIGTEDGELPSGAELESLLDASAGLTRYEAESAYSLSLVREGRVTSPAVWELKTQTLKKSGLLQLHRGPECFHDLGGLDNLKSFTRRALMPRPTQTRRQRARGVLLLSPPGCGKSQFCKALGNEVGRPVLSLDVGSLMGSLVGETEQRTRQALKIIDAMSPCVAMIDEVEKAFAGSSAGGQNDSGVSSRMLGTFLSWLNDHESDVFVVCTANDVGKLPPEFARAERFDSVFFLDLPTRQEKDVYLDLHSGEFRTDSDNTFLLKRGPADFAEQVVLLIDQHDVLNLEFASASHIEVARETHQTDDVQIDDNAVVSRGERPDRAWVSAWVWVDAADH